MSKLTSKRPPVSPVFVIAFGILSVSTASIFIRYAQSYAPSLVIAAYRLSIASFLLAPIAWHRHQDEIRHLSRKKILLALLSGFFLAIHFGTWISSLEYTTVASSVVIVSTSPLWVALLSPFFLKEPLTRPVLMGLAITLGGGIIIGISDSCTIGQAALHCPEFAAMVKGETFLGNGLALLGAFAGAGYLLIGRKLRVELSLVPYITIVYGAAAIILGGVVGLVGLPVLGFPPVVYLWLILLAIVPQIFGHSSFNWALGYLPAAIVSITLLGEPVGSSILAYFILGETPTPVKMFGAILILAGILIASNVQPEPQETGAVKVIIPD